MTIKGTCDKSPVLPHPHWPYICLNWRPLDEAPQPTPPSDPLGPRSAERHDSVYGLPHENIYKWGDIINFDHKGYVRIEDRYRSRQQA